METYVLVVCVRGQQSACVFNSHEEAMREGAKMAREHECSPYTRSPLPAHVQFRWRSRANKDYVEVLRPKA